MIQAVFHNTGRDIVPLVALVLHVHCSATQDHTIKHVVGLWKTIVHWFLKFIQQYGARSWALVLTSSAI